MNALRRFDRGLARGEAAIAASVLLIMIVIAATQAVLRNLTNFEFSWANAALQHMDWADSFLQKGTLWLAFFGASLATHDEKHIAIDVFQRISSARPRALMRGLVCAFAGVTCFYLGRVFWLSVLNNARELPLEYSVLGVNGGMAHICEATAEAIQLADLTRPSIFCAIRSVLEMFGAQMSTPDTALQLVVPTMFIFMAVRFLLRSIASLYGFATGNLTEEHA